MEISQEMTKWPGKKPHAWNVTALSPRRCCWSLVATKHTLILCSLFSVLGWASHSQVTFILILKPLGHQDECWLLARVSFHFKSQARLVQRTDFPGDLKSSPKMNINEGTVLGLPLYLSTVKWGCIVGWRLPSHVLWKEKLSWAEDFPKWDRMQLP